MSIKLDYYFKNLSEFPIEGFFDGISTPHEALAKAKTVLKELLVEPDVKVNKGTLKADDDAHFYGNYFIDEGTVIYNDVTIIGPVYIGKNVEIMPGAVIRPNTIICDNCSVGHGSEAKHVIMLPGAKIASMAFAGDSFFGRGAQAGSGVITANRKFNRSNATVRIDGERHDLGDGFFGCVLGDSSRLGANSVTQPGTHIGPYVWVYPMTNVRGFVPAQKRVYHERELTLEENEVFDLG